jgi:uncharacterized lipoprotein YmbA
MTRLQPHRCAAGAAILLLGGLAACGHTAPTRYFSLAAVPPAAASDPTAGPVNLGRLSVRWPPAFDRLEVVQPTGSVNVQVDELTRWSAAPGELAAAALAEDLRARLPSLTLTPAASVPSSDALDVAVEVIGLDVQEGAYRLTASVVIDDAAGATRSRRTFTVSTPETGAGPAAEAKALSGLLAAVADRIAPDLDAAVSGEPARTALSASRRPAP